MKARSGGCSLILLLGMLYLLMLGHLILLHVKNDFQRTVEQIQGLRERQLCSSLATWLLNQQEPPPSLSFTTSFMPGAVQVNVQASQSQSSDNAFSKLNVQVTSKFSQQNLNRWQFSPSSEHQLLGAQYMFISKYQPEGASYISDSKLYTSTGSPALPDISFLNGKAHTSLDMEELHDYGFDSNFIYLTSSKTITYKTTAKTTKGNGLIACTSGITLDKNFTHSGRLILISNASITIGDSVKLPNALIIAKNNVTIGTGCTLKGVIFAGNKIKILGKGNFTHDASAVASYASAFYIA